MVTILSLVICWWLIRQLMSNRVSSRPPPEISPPPPPDNRLWTVDIQGYATKLVVGPCDTEGEALYETLHQGIPARKVKSIKRGV